MTTMQRIALAYTIPEWMFRFDSVSRVAHDVYWICEQCERAAREKVASAQKETISTRCYSWLGPEYQADSLEEKSFENFYPQHQEDKKAYHGYLATARMYATRLVEKQQVNNLEMIGSCGTGKTHLAAAICNHLRINHVSCLFCTVPDLFNELYRSSFELQQQLLAQANSTMLLVLDDLDKLHVRLDTNGEFQKGKLFGILNRRYLRKLPTIITANEESDFSRWLDEATISRLSERLTPMLMHGVDYRQRGRR